MYPEMLLHRKLFDKSQQLIRVQFPDSYRGCFPRKSSLKSSIKRKRPVTYGKHFQQPKKSWYLCWYTSLRQARNILKQIKIKHTSSPVAPPFHFPSESASGHKALADFALGALPDPLHTATIRSNPLTFERFVGKIVGNAEVTDLRYLQLEIHP
jgi:hypothetical protein